VTTMLLIVWWWWCRWSSWCTSNCLSYWWGQIEESFQWFIDVSCVVTPCSCRCCYNILLVKGECWIL
jgi:hypothetical protein